jgi:hypothetical protein
MRRRQTELDVGFEFKSNGNVRSIKVYSLNLVTLGIALIEQRKNEDKVN